MTSLSQLAEAGPFPVQQKLLVSLGYSCLHKSTETVHVTVLTAELLLLVLQLLRETSGLPLFSRQLNLLFHLPLLSGGVSLHPPPLPLIPELVLKSAFLCDVLSAPAAVFSARCHSPSLAL